MDPAELSARAFRRHDETADAEFYVAPRFVTHIDDGAIGAVTQLYRELLPQGGAILDLMSSWVSHLPADVEYRRVVGLGMNRDELEGNPRLESWLVHDLNADPRLPFADGEFDAATICVSIQYLVQPVTLAREIGRVVQTGGPLIVTFSNRCFPTKAIMLWQMLGDDGHRELVEQYLTAAGNWADVRSSDRSPSPGRGDPLYAVVGRSLGPPI